MEVKLEVKMEVKLDITQTGGCIPNYRPASFAGFTPCAKRITSNLTPFYNSQKLNYFTKYFLVEPSEFLMTLTPF